MTKNSYCDSIHIYQANMEASRLAGGKGRRHNPSMLRRNKPVVEYMLGREDSEQSDFDKKHDSSGEWSHAYFVTYRNHAGVKDNK